MNSIFYSLQKRLDVMACDLTFRQRRAAVFFIIASCWSSFVSAAKEA
jgi:hypothetical protein